jgi:hypothetical protein
MNDTREVVSNYFAKLADPRGKQPETSRFTRVAKA